jgi:hypothetical protein
MAHFAELDENNVVVRVLVTDNDDPNGDEGYQWLLDNLGGTWVKTSYNGTIRKNYAGVGYEYNEELDAFVAPSPFESWVLDEETAQWEAPTPKPEDGAMYDWNEDTLSWDAIPTPDEPMPLTP